MDYRYETYTGGRIDSFSHAGEIGVMVIEDEEARTRESSAEVGQLVHDGFFVVSPIQMHDSKRGLMM